MGKCHSVKVVNSKMCGPLTLNCTRHGSIMTLISYPGFDSTMNQWHADVVVNLKMSELLSPLTLNHTKPWLHDGGNFPVSSP